LLQEFCRKRGKISTHSHWIIKSSSWRWSYKQAATLVGRRSVGQRRQPRWRQCWIF